MCVCVCAKSLRRVQLFMTLWTIAHQAPPACGQVGNYGSTLSTFLALGNRLLTDSGSTTQSVSCTPVWSRAPSHVSSCPRYSGQLSQDSRSGHGNAVKLLPPVSLSNRCPCVARRFWFFQGLLRILHLPKVVVLHGFPSGRSPSFPPLSPRPPALCGVAFLSRVCLGYHLGLASSSLCC